MKVLGVDHITVNCRDAAKSFQFYEEVMGLQKLSEVDLGDSVLHYYGLPGTRLELIVYAGPKKQLETGNTDVGIYRHMALVVDHLEEYHRRCLEAGCKINLEPVYMPQIDRTVMLVVDPNGVEIELIQGW